MVGRRALLAGMAATVAAPHVVRSQTTNIVDVLGNDIEIPKLPERIVLLDATDYFSVSALVPNPFEYIVGWASLARVDLGATTILNGINIAEVGKLSADTVSLESILALKPDLVVASSYMLPPGGSAIQDTLSKFSIPLAWTSGYNDALSPDVKLRRGLRFWGDVLGKQVQARQIIDFANSRYATVRACTDTGYRPRTYMEIQTTYDACCWAAGRALFGDLFDIAGGELLTGSDGWGTQLSEEALIQMAPEVYVATGGNFAPDRQPAIGPGLDTATGRNGLARAADRKALRNSPAVRDGRVHGVWTGLITTPILTPVFAEYLGSWLHPQNCSNLDPSTTLDTINTYLAHPIPGPLGLSLEDA